MDNLTDEQLLRLCCEGNQKAFCPLMKRHKKLVYGIVYARTRDPYTSEDILQEVFIKLWKNVKKIKDPSKLKPWLKRTTIHTIVDYTRSGSYKYESPTEETYFHQIMDDRTGNAQEKMELEEIISSLTQDEEKIIGLRYSGMKVAEIAKKMGVSQGQMSKTINKINEKVRKLWEGYE